MLLSIDPGLATGWALWSPALAGCGLGDPPSEFSPSDVWIEAPVIYPRSKARPADITKLSREAGEWAGRYHSVGAQAHYVRPSEWKGQLPKDVCHARVWAVLDAKEQDIVRKALKGMAPSKRHNVLDAVGIGLWVLRRAFR